MRDGVHSTGITIGAIPASPITPRCVEKCVTKCVNALHTSTAARPRQHWVFATSPSPTTRPPRRSSVGLVRVVGLGVFSSLVLAGAGGRSETVQAELVVSLEGDGGRDLEWLG